jgi:hypothetical protein
VLHLDFATAIIKDMGDEIPPENISEEELVRRRTKALNVGKIPSLSSTSARSNGDSAGPRLLPGNCVKI